MFLENPNMIWLLLFLIPMMILILLCERKNIKVISTLFPSITKRVERKQLEKYFTAGVLLILLTFTLASPKVVDILPIEEQKCGEILFLVDVSRSMNAQTKPDIPSRIDRIKPILIDIINHLKDQGEVKISLYGFTNIARSLVPFINNEDFYYLAESIEKVLDINSIPGEGTSLGRPILDVVGKFDGANKNNLIILISDGEVFSDTTRRIMTHVEKSLIQEAIQNALDENIKIITVGVGELEGAKIPIYDEEGRFTGIYANLQDIEYVSYLVEDTLKEIASKTNGEYFYEDNTKLLIEYIFSNLGSVDDQGVSATNEYYKPISKLVMLIVIPIWILFSRFYLLN